MWQRLSQQWYKPAPQVSMQSSKQFKRSIFRVVSLLNSSACHKTNCWFFGFLMKFVLEIARHNKYCNVPNIGFFIENLCILIYEIRSTEHNIHEKNIYLYTKLHCGNLKIWNMQHDHSYDFNWSTSGHLFFKQGAKLALAELLPSVVWKDDNRGIPRALCLQATRFNLIPIQKCALKAW